jgi:glycosyltransferase involved in cell wall biosynthesis
MNVFLIDLESVESRYTGEWKRHVPDLLSKAGHNVRVISGPRDIPPATTPGAFLNFGGTNIYKANQVEQISRLFCEGSINAGDHFLFTDSWHPGIINLKYMSELLGIPVVTHGLWHAGSYDPQDFLGRLVGDKPWVRHAEQSFYHAIDHNYFATEFHIDLFANTFGKNSATEFWKTIEKRSGKIVRTGWPMEYMKDTLENYNTNPKRDLILFPHRIAPEKQVEIFRDLATQLPQYEFVVCQDTPLDKHEYHKLLGRSKIIFSANLQETLGISTCSEGPLVNAVPLAPDRLSYTEIFRNHKDFLYPSEWTQNWDSYLISRDLLIKKIKDIMNNYDQLTPKIINYLDTDYKNYFHATNILKNFT